MDDMPKWFLMPTIYWDNVTLRERPKLPVVKWKRGKTTYTMTDLRYLRQDAVAILFKIIKTVAIHPDMERMTFHVPDNMAEGELQTVIDIVTGIKFTEKEGRHTSDSTFLCHGCLRSEYKGKREVEFLLSKWQNEDIAEFAEQTLDGRIDVRELVEYMARKTTQRFKEAKVIAFEDAGGQ